MAKNIKTQEDFIREAKQEALAKEIAARIGPEIKLTRREKSPMNEEYMKQMTAMMITANLYNCSPGRDPKTTARIAIKAANALWE